jgi:hypothetical protein
MIFGVYKAHAGQACGAPIAAYRADSKDAAWSMFCAEFSLAHSMRRDFKVVAV